LNEEYIYRVEGSDTKAISLDDFESTSTGQKYKDVVADRDISRNYRDKETDEFKELYVAWETSGATGVEPTLKPVTDARNILQPESYSFYRKSNAAEIASDKSGVERYLFVVDMSGTDGLTRDGSDMTENITWESYVALGAKENSSKINGTLKDQDAIKFDYSDKDLTKYCSSAIDDLKLESKRTLKLENTDSNPVYHFGTNYNDMTVNFKLIDSVTSSYEFEKDVQNYANPYLDIVGTLVETLPDGTENSIAIPAGTIMQYNKNNAESLSSLESFFLFRDHNEIYDMGTALGTEKTKETQISLTFDWTNAVGLNIDSSNSYKLVLELKRSASQDFPNTAETVSTLEIPLTVDSTSNDFGYRMNVNSMSQLNVNLNNATQQGIEIINQFSGVSEDNVNAQIRYTLYYKETLKDGTAQYREYGSYLEGVANKNYSTISISGNNALGSAITPAFGNSVSVWPWYLDSVKEGADASELPGGYRVTNNQDGSVTIERTSEKELNQSYRYTMSMTYDQKSKTITSITATKLETFGNQYGTYTWQNGALEVTNDQQNSEDLRQSIEELFRSVTENGTTAVYSSETSLEDVQQEMAFLETIIDDMLQYLRSGSKKSTNITDANGKTVYEYKSDVSISGLTSDSETTTYNLPLGNYKLVGELMVDGVAVASDYIIFNVNKAEIYPVIQESNKWSYDWNFE
jgi:hypothetical protein